MGKLDIWWGAINEISNKICFKKIDFKQFLLKNVTVTSFAYKEQNLKDYGYNSRDLTRDTIRKKTNFRSKHL